MLAVRVSVLHNVANFLLRWLWNSNSDFSELSINHSGQCPLNQQSRGQRPDPFSDMHRYTDMKCSLHIQPPTHTLSQKSPDKRRKSSGACLPNFACKTKDWKAKSEKVCKSVKVYFELNILEINLNLILSMNWQLLQFRCYSSCMSWTILFLQSSFLTAPLSENVAPPKNGWHHMMIGNKIFYGA